MNNKTGLVFIFLVICGLIGWRFYAAAGPDKTSGAALVQVTVPQLSDEMKIGQSLFGSKCGACHGVNAAGQDGVAPPLVHKIYEPGHHGDVSFRLAAKNGVRAHHWRFGNMPPVKDVTDDEMTKIIAFVRTLQRANGIN